MELLVTAISFLVREEAAVILKGWHFSEKSRINLFSERVTLEERFPHTPLYRPLFELAVYGNCLLFFPLGLSFAPFFSMELVAGTIRKLTFIEHLLCFGVGGPVRTIGLMGGITFSWQAYSLQCTFRSPAYSFEFSSHLALFLWFNYCYSAFLNNWLEGDTCPLLIWGFRS